MSNWLASIASAGTKVWNTLRAVGPFLISQSDKTSEAFVRHEKRRAEVELGREFLRGEIETRKVVRTSLLQKMADANPEEMIGIRQKLEYLDETTRAVGIAAKALDYVKTPALPASGDSPNEQQPSDEPKIGEIEPHWLDHFNDFARKRNEDWREELLARALARESEKPGSVSPRALWTIGSMDKSSFEQLTDLLNVCFWSYPRYNPFLPSGAMDPFGIIIAGGSTSIGHIVYSLEDLGLVADTLSSSISTPAGNQWIVCYAKRVVLLKVKKQFEVRGVIFSRLGNSIAEFFEPAPSTQGEELFEKWIKSLPGDSIEVIEIEEVAPGKWQKSSKQVAPPTEPQKDK